MRESKSKKPSKQRKNFFQASPHRRGRKVSAHLAADLKEKHQRRSVPLCIGDTVKIMRGDFSGIEGKISEVDRQAYRVYIEGVTREKVSGENVKVSIHASNVLITDLKVDDKWKPTVGCTLDREYGRFAMRQWEKRNPNDEFRLRKYIRTD